MEANNSEGFLLKAREMARRLSTLGRFVPRSIELIWDTLNLAAVANSLSD